MISLGTGNLDAYRDYRLAGLQWLEQIPKHWGVQSLGQVGILTKGLETRTETPILPKPSFS